jgi:hypothetical protein
MSLTQQEIQRKMKLVISERRAYKELILEFCDLLEKMDITHLRSSKPHPELDLATDYTFIQHEWRNFKIARVKLLQRMKKMAGPVKSLHQRRKAQQK